MRFHNPPSNRPIHQRHPHHNRPHNPTRCRRQRKILNLRKPQRLKNRRHAPRRSMPPFKAHRHHPRKQIRQPQPRPQQQQDHQTSHRILPPRHQLPIRQLPATTPPHGPHPRQPLPQKQCRKHHINQQPRQRTPSRSPLIAHLKRTRLQPLQQPQSQQPPHHTRR